MTAGLGDLLADEGLVAFIEATIAVLPNQRSAMQIFQFLIIPQYVLGPAGRHSGPSAAKLGPAALRAAQRRRAEARPPGPALPAVGDIEIPGALAARLYRPAPGPVPG